MALMKIIMTFVFRKLIVIKETMGKDSHWKTLLFNLDVFIL